MAKTKDNKSENTSDVSRRSGAMRPYSQLGGAVSRPSGWPIGRLRAEFDRLFDDFIGGLGGLPAFTGMGESGWDLNIDDQDDKIVVHAEAPGFEPDDFDIQVSGNQLVMCACENEESQQDGGRHWQHKELYRALPLPSEVDAEHVEANYRNGILTITLPKTEESKSRRIEVKS